MTIIPNNNAWCAQVTEIPDNTKIKVFNNGTPQGENTFKLCGGIHILFQYLVINLNGKTPKKMKKKT